MSFKSSLRIHGLRWDHLWVLAIVVVGSWCGVTHGQCVPVALHGSDTVAGDWFGTSVKISGNRAIVGANQHLHSGVRSGAAYVFQLDRNGIWQQQAELLPSMTNEGANFGVSVDLDGDVAVIGALGDDVGGMDAGAAYVFRFDSVAGWNEEARLTASPPIAGTWFGRSVAISGDAVVVGMLALNGQPGVAYAFRRDAQSKSWTQETILVPSDSEPDDWFGAQVDIDGDRIIVGAMRHGPGEEWQGAAYIFRHGVEGWTQEAELHSLTPRFDLGFGAAVSLSGDAALIGGSSTDPDQQPGLRAYVFRLSASNASWRLEAQLAPGFATAFVVPARWVALEDHTAVMGDMYPHSNSFGAAHVWRQQQNAEAWPMIADLRSPGSPILGGPIGGFGRSVSVSGDWTIVGDRTDMSLGYDAGAAFIFNLTCYVLGDANHDQLVDADDLGAVINSWGPCPWLTSPETCPADVTHNGTVDIDDLVLVITHWSQN